MLFFEIGQMIGTNDKQRGLILVNMVGEGVDPIYVLELCPGLCYCDAMERYCVLDPILTVYQAMLDLN